MKKGLFELSNMGRGGKPVLATRSGEGTLLSELALFTLCERKFTAVVAEDSEVIRITRTLFHRLVEEYPDVADMVIDRIRNNLASLASGAAGMQHRFN